MIRKFSRWKSAGSLSAPDQYTHHFRELENLLHLALGTPAPGTLGLTKEVQAEVTLPSSAALESLTTEDMRRALPQAASVRQAAERLGLKSRYALCRLMKKHGIKPTSSTVE